MSAKSSALDTVSGAPPGEAVCERHSLGLNLLLPVSQFRRIHGALLAGTISVYFSVILIFSVKL